MSAGIFFVRHQGKIRGPFTVDQVSRLVVMGTVTVTAEVSSDRALWQPLATHPTFTAPQPSFAAGESAADEYDLDLSGLPSSRAAHTPASVTGSEWFDSVDLNAMTDS